jgi:L-ribulokinase
LTWPLQNILSQSTIIDAATIDRLIKETEDAIIPKLSKLACGITGYRRK